MWDQEAATAHDLDHIEVRRGAVPGPGVTRGYIRLDATDVPANYSSATLWLYCYVGGSSGITIKINEAASTWDEDTLTWNNQPNGAGSNPTGAVLDSFTVQSGWNEVDVPAGLDPSVGLVLWTSNAIDELKFYSKEAATESNRPYFQFFR